MTKIFVYEIFKSLLSVFIYIMQKCPNFFGIGVIKGDDYTVAASCLSSLTVSDLIRSRSVFLLCFYTPSVQHLAQFKLFHCTLEMNYSYLLKYYKEESSTFTKTI